MARIAPTAGTMLLVPNIRAPRVCTARLKCRPGVGNPKSSRAGNNAAIPDNGSRLSIATSVLRDLNAVCGLTHRVQSRRGYGQLPGKLRMSFGNR